MQLARLDPKTLKAHPLHARIYGDGADEAFVESVRERGVIVPLVVSARNGHHVVIAGHRRRSAAIRLGLASIECRVREFKDKTQERIAVIESNRQRTKTVAQLLAEGLAVKRLHREEAAQRQAEGRRHGGEKAGRGRPIALPTDGGEAIADRHQRETSERVAKSIGLNSRHQWEQLEEIGRDAPPGALDTIDRRVIGQLAREKKRRQRLAKMAVPPLVAGKVRYAVVYADPPWRYEHDVSGSRAIENQYPTLSTDDVAALPVAEIAAANSILFLWSPPPLIAHALRVVAAWGFSYRTHLVWVKDRIGMGYWARQRHELLLVGTRGELPPPSPKDRPDSVIEAPRAGHSQKPVCVYSLIERMYADAPRIELFARSQREGWARWGDEA